MQQIKVKDLMVPLAEYVTVPRNATVYQAVEALEQSWATKTKGGHRHRAVLVLDRKKNVVGKLSQHAIVRVLEPKYSEIGDLDRLTHFGLNVDFLQSMVERQELWTDPLKTLCTRAASLKVKDVMTIPGEEDYVKHDATLAHACHMLVMGHKLSLLVTKGKQVIGVLRLVDVFDKIRELIKTCAT
ncbi:MAG: CBS domain-containing protein [Thermodesulfobacteriota bacterium]